jgi:hypothetical protein
MPEALDSITSTADNNKMYSLTNLNNKHFNLSKSYWQYVTDDENKSLEKLLSKALATDKNYSAKSTVIYPSF